LDYYLNLYARLNNMVITLGFHSFPEGVSKVVLTGFSAFYSY
jgi:hypothetical protein